MRTPFLLRLVFALLLGTSGLAADWFPVATIADGKPQSYQPLRKASKSWRICALLPHGKDKYWWGVSWGLAEEARRQGIKLGIYQAGGYENLAQQQRQFADCLALKADAIVLAAISAKGLDADIARAAAGRVPVIDLINGIDSSAVASHSRVSFADMAATAVRYLLKQHGNKPAKLAWLPGPAGAGWVVDADYGARQALQGSPLQLIAGGYAPTDSSSQMRLVRNFFGRQPADYVLANAVGAESAVNYLQASGMDNVRVLAYYATEPVIELIRSGRLLAAPSDAPVIQARIAVDLAVRILEQQPYARQVSPVIEILDAKTLPGYDLTRLLPPKDQWLIQQPLPN